jgi:hypothetical protein
VTVPIRPENRARYPEDWPAISQRIRFERAKGRCECDGRCGNHAEGRGLDTDGRCTRRHGDPLPNGRPVILTTAHLEHEPERCADEDLMAMCQGCHLSYDREHHAQTRAAARAAAMLADGQEPLFDLAAS